MEHKRCFGCMQIHSQSPVCEHCGYNENVPNLPHQLPTGVMLQNRYLIGKALGQGGFGITYLGWDMDLEIPVAIKEYFPNGLVNREGTQTQQVSCYEGNSTSLFQNNRDRFLREARVLARLSNIPEIVHILNLFLANNTAYIVMEYIQGIDLKRYLKIRGGKLTPEETFAILRPIMMSLTKVHEAGLVHRDISPDNIMILPSGQTKLLDFGAAREVENPEVDKELPLSTEAILKHGFAPIEQYQRRGGLGPWTDVYALCATIFYCLTGSVPPDAPERVMEDLDIPWNTIPGLMPRQVQALEKGMAIRAKDRIRSVEEFYQALFVQASYVPTAAPSRPEEPAPFTSAPQEKNPYPNYTVPLQDGTAPAVSAPISGAPKLAKKLPVKWLAVGAAAISVLVLAGIFLLKKGQEPPVMQAPEANPRPAATAPVPEATVSTISSPEQPEVQIADLSGPGWEDNIPMADPVDRGVNSGNLDAAFASPVYGSQYQRNQIHSITFLDSMEGANTDWWYISRDRNNAVVAWVKPAAPSEDWEGAEPAYDLYIAGNGGINAAPVCEGLFSCYKYLRTINFNDCFHTEGATSMKEMFYFCRDLQTFDLSCFDTSAVTDMQYMFHYCCSPCQVDLSSFDTSKVTNMDYMFSQFTSWHFAVDTPVTALDLSHFDTSGVTSMRHMFDSCSGLQTLDVSGFDTSKVTDMQLMFASCESLTELDLSSFDTANVTSMQMMFYQCRALERLNIRNFETGSLRNATKIFAGLLPDIQVIYDSAKLKFAKSSFSNYKDFYVPESMGSPENFIKD